MSDMSAAVWKSVRHLLFFLPLQSIHLSLIENPPLGCRGFFCRSCIHTFWKFCASNVLFFCCSLWLCLFSLLLCCHLLFLCLHSPFTFIFLEIHIMLLTCAVFHPFSLDVCHQSLYGPCTYLCLECKIGRETGRRKLLDCIIEMSVISC